MKIKEKDFANLDESIDVGFKVCIVIITLIVSAIIYLIKNIL